MSVNTWKAVNTWGAQSYTLALESGAYLLTGGEIGLLSSRALALDTGVYNYSSGSMTLTYNQIGGQTYIIQLESGQYLLSGGVMNINYSGDLVTLIDSYTMAYKSSYAKINYLN